jgi:hypothetical protein
MYAFIAVMLGWLPWLFHYGGSFRILQKIAIFVPSLVVAYILEV